MKTEEEVHREINFISLLIAQYTRKLSEPKQGIPNENFYRECAEDNKKELEGIVETLKEYLRLTEKISLIHSLTHS